MAKAKKRRGRRAEARQPGLRVLWNPENYVAGFTVAGLILAACVVWLLVSARLPQERALQQVEGRVSSFDSTDSAVQIWLDGEQQAFELACIDDVLPNQDIFLSVLYQKPVVKMLVDSNSPAEIWQLESGGVTYVAFADCLQAAKHNWHVALILCAVLVLGYVGATFCFFYVVSVTIYLARFFL